MVDVLRAACVQINGAPEIEENLKTVGALVREAAGRGAKLIATPENTCRMVRDERKIITSLSEENHPGIPFFSELAKELGVWLLIGSLAIRTGKTQIANRSFLFADNGNIAATYDKIHMFDVDLSGDKSYRESKAVQPGEKAVVAGTPWGGLGMSICYDVRFAYLYRDLAKAGANILTVPAAFTVPTGKAHWEVLLRARAIETGSFVLAPAQTGDHDGGRKTWGHSMIIGPWGEILAAAGTETGIITADLNLDEVAKVRQSIPALRHDKKYKVVKA